jgi:hypothetical protein
LLRVAPEQLRLLPGTDDEILKTLERKYAVVRVASRTPLAEQIVRLYRPELRGQRRIRWLDHLDEALEAVFEGCPERAGEVAA